MRAAAEDAGAGTGDVLGRLDSLDVAYCQTWQYDDPVARLADALGIAPRRQRYSGIGGTTPQVLVGEAAEAIGRGDLDVAVVCGAEALATKRAWKKRGERYPYRFRPDPRPPFPWEAPFHPAEVAHDVFQAWLTFALFDNARRAHLGRGLGEHRRDLGALMAPLTAVAAANPDAWYPVERTPEELVTATPENRMVGYPYTKYLVSVMDVDMAAALILASHEAADALGVPTEQRVYVRGWCYATDPTYVAEHPELWRAPAMAAAANEALCGAGVGIDDVAHLDLYSCFPSSVAFACDALGIHPPAGRSLTVTGGLPYHGGAGSNYVTHSIATMARTLRADPGSLGVVSGVGMHMTKHAYGVYSTDPGREGVAPADRTGVQARLDATPAVPIVECHEGEATVSAYSVVHGRSGAPEHGVVVCDVPGGGRAYATIREADLLAEAERTELVGRTLTLTPEVVDLPTGGRGTCHVARD